MDFCHLHVHNEYSLLDGFGTAENYAAKAAELGFGYLALTNHGNVDGVLKFQNACLKYGIKPIIGCEFYLVQDLAIKNKGELRAHAIVLVKNDVGWTNMLKMLTVASTEGYYYRPRIDPKILLESLDGLVVMTACTASFLRIDWGMGLFEDLADAIPEDLFLEIMPHQMKEQMELNKRCLELQKRYDIPLVATNDCHYIGREDEKSQEVLLAIQGRNKWKDPKRFRFTIGGLYLRSAEEMEKAFSEQNCIERSIYCKAMRSTMMVVKRCADFVVQPLSVQLPVVPNFEGIKDEDALRELCAKGYQEKIVAERKDSSVYRDRLEEEINSIIDLGFARYFLIVWELIDWCSRNDVMVGPGRGSVGGCLVAYLLGITMVDPIKYKLVFTRFISPARIDLPDIDMDFEDSKRHLVRKHLEDIYGEHHVAAVSTFSTMKGRGAVRDVSRVFDIPLVDVDKAAKAIVVRSGGDFRCLAEDTQVCGHKGRKAIKDLVVGDVIAAAGEQGVEWREVGAIFYSGEMDVCEVELESGKKIVCTKNHRILVGGEWKKLEDIKNGDCVLTCEDEEIYGT